MRTALIRYPARAVGLMEIENLFLLRQPWGCSPRLSRAKPVCAGYGGGNTPHHPCASVIAAPIRVLFRLSEAKPACARLWRIMYSKTMTPGGRWSVFARCNLVRAVFSEQHEGRDP